MVLPLRVLLEGRGGDTSPAQLAHTIEISQIGCRLGGLRTELAPGQTITLQRGQQKAAFRVVWSKHLAPNENQAGIEALDYERDIWGLEIPSHQIAERPQEHIAGPEQSEVNAGPPPALSSVAKSSASTWSAPHKSSGHGALNLRLNGLSLSRLSLSDVTDFLRTRWGVACSAAFVCCLLALGVAVWQGNSDSLLMAVRPAVPAPPTAEELARLTPKPRHLMASLTAPISSSAPLLQVAEAPTAHLVYPVAPDSSITGKVQLQIIVAANGLVKQIHLLSGNQTLAQSAAEAVRYWRYGTLKTDDGSVERETSVTVSFLGNDAVVLEFPKAQFRAN
jgi:hypothetical protein